MPIGYGPPDADKIPLINIKLYKVALELWPKRLLRDDGTAHLPAVHALFTIVKWYMPAEESDGTKKETYYRKRYKDDQLQLSAPQLATASGLTVKQARDALDKLEEKGYINCTLRTIYYNGVAVPKRQFIALNVEAVIALSTLTKDDVNAMYQKAEQNTNWSDDNQPEPQDQPDFTITRPSALQGKRFAPEGDYHKSLHKKQEEDSFFQKEGELENPSIATPPESVLPIKEIPKLDVVSKTGNGVMSTGYVEQVKVFDVEQEVAVILPPNATYPVKVKVQNAPVAARVFAEILPAEPTSVKGKTKKAAVAKTPKPPKEPKAPRELDPREAEFLAQVEKIDPFMGKQVESRLRKYRRGEPWSAIQVFLLTGKHVPAASLRAVTSLNGTAFDTELMLKCLSAWVSKGWSPVNLAWLLEWYKAGGPPQYKSNGYGQQVQQQPDPAPSKPQLVFDDPLVEDVAQWVYAKPGYKGKGLYSIKLAMWYTLNGKPTQQMSNAEAELAEYWAAHQ